MLIFLPSTPATENASAFLAEKGVAHELIPVPEDLGYKTGSDVCLYIAPEAHADHSLDIPMELTRQRFVVMRVFKDYIR